MAALEKPERRIRGGSSLSLLAELPFEFRNADFQRNMFRMTATCIADRRERPTERRHAE
jgi:hypothetical protein